MKKFLRKLNEFLEEAYIGRIFAFFGGFLILNHTILGIVCIVLALLCIGLSTYFYLEYQKRIKELEGKK